MTSDRQNSSPKHRAVVTGAGEPLPPGVSAIPVPSRTFPTPEELGGLRESEIESQRDRFGTNRLSPPPRPPWWTGWLRQFDDPIIRILLVTAGATALIGISDGSLLESAVIGLIILLATLIGFISEERAEREFGLLISARECVPVRVIRDGAMISIARSDIVVDDIIWLEAGDEVPADGFLLNGQAVEVDESMLTGDRPSISKVPYDPHAIVVTDAGLSSSDRLQRGSIVTHGRGVMRVTSVGDATKLGQAGAAAAAEREEPSPLRLQLDGIARAIAFFGVSISALVFTVLIAGRIASGSISFTPAEAWAHASFGLGIAAMIFPFWLPAALDVLAILGFEVTGRDLFATPPWRLGLRWGGIFVGAGLFLGIAAGILPPVLATWGNRPLESALLQDFLQTLALIVVAVPDGLSMSITLCLAWGMRRLLAGRTLVRRLHACETIGAVTVICTGDSGAMLEPRLSVGNVIQGRSLQSPETVPHQLLAEAMAVNATAHLARRRGDPPVTIGDPLEGALLFWLRDRGISYMSHRSDFELYRQWQAGPDTWFMATLGHPAEKNSPDSWRLHVKAQGDMLLKRCRNALVDGNIVSLEAGSPARVALEKHLESLSPNGRTIGFAMREGTGAYPDDPAVDLTWLGGVLITGSISPETAAALDQCRRAGIRVTLVSSASPESVARVAREAGLGSADADVGSILTGEAMHRLDGMHAAHAAGRLAVLARADASDRTKLIDLLRQRGEVVAAVGDHDADVASLRRADIGLVMGNGASERIRSAGDLVLPDEGLPVLLSAVKWGRALFLNIQRFLVFQLSVNLMALGINLLGPFIGVRLPLTILQMLWVNIIMDIFSALALATEPPHAGILDAPPRRSRDFIVTGAMIQAIMTTSALSLSAFVLVLRHWQSPDGSIDARRLTWFFCLFVLVQLWNLVNARGFGARRPPWLGLGENRWFGTMFLAILLTQAAIVQWGGTLFRTVPLSLTEWAALIVGTSPLLIVGRALGYPGLRRRMG